MQIELLGIESLRGGALVNEKKEIKIACCSSCVKEQKTSRYETRLRNSELCIFFMFYLIKFITKKKVKHTSYK